MSDTLDLDARARRAANLARERILLLEEAANLQDALDGVADAVGRANMDDADGDHGVAVSKAIASALAERDVARAEVERFRKSVRQVLSEVGCDCCDCDCGAVADVHDPGCSPVTCLACRVEDALAAPEDVTHG